MLIVTFCIHFRDIILIFEPNAEPIPLIPIRVMLRYSRVRYSRYFRGTYPPRIPGFACITYIQLHSNPLEDLQLSKASNLHKLNDNCVIYKHHYNDRCDDCKIIWFKIPANGAPSFSDK